MQRDGFINFSVCSRDENRKTDFSPLLPSEVEIPSALSMIFDSGTWLRRSFSCSFPKWRANIHEDRTFLSRWRYVSFHRKKKKKKDREKFQITEFFALTFRKLKLERFNLRSVAKFIYERGSSNKHREYKSFLFFFFFFFSSECTTWIFFIKTIVKVCPWKDEVSLAIFSNLFLLHSFDRFCGISTTSPVVRRNHKILDTRGTSRMTVKNTILMRFNFQCNPIGCNLPNTIYVPSLATQSVQWSWHFRDFLSFLFLLLYAPFIIIKCNITYSTKRNDYISIRIILIILRIINFQIHRKATDKMNSFHRLLSIV